MANSCFPPIAGEDFAQSATRLAGLTGVLLGWRPGEFWAATPAELGAILDALVPPATVPPKADAVAELQRRFPDG